jgi:hypothetical protein
MLGIKITASIPAFDKVAYLIAVQQHMKDVFIKASRQFLLKAIPLIPFRTGFIRGAFKNLEDIAGQVGGEGTGYRIRTGRTGGVRAKSSQEYYYGTGSKILKTTQSGRQFSTPPDQILQVTGASLASGRFAFYFKFEINITYFDIMDKKVWGAFKAGSEALETYIRTNIQTNFPDIGKFLVRKS